VTLKLAETSLVRSRPSAPYGANLFIVRCVVMQAIQQLSYVGILTANTVLTTEFHKFHKNGEMIVPMLCLTVDVFVCIPVSSTLTYVVHCSRLVDHQWK